MTREDAVRQLFDRTVALSAEQRTALLDGQADDVVSQTHLLLTAATVVGARSTAPPPPVPPTPERVGRYEITGVLGQGGFGIVYRGHDTVLKRPVAIKTCISEDPERREQFVHEAEISARLQHPNIVTIYDFGVEDGLPYLVQELLSGADMSDTILLHSKPSRVDAIERRAEVLVGVADGLAHAHRHGVIHRDIKPGNVRLTDTGAIKLLDFGIARLLQHHGDLTSEGEAAGTIGYLAPELLEGHTVGKPADVFSYGALAYEWLSGQRAFRGTSFSEVAYNLLFRAVDVEPLRTAGVADSLIGVVSRCLEKDPTDRFTDAEELADHLRDLTASGSLTGMIETPVEPAIERDVDEPVEAEAPDAVTIGRRWLAITAVALVVAALGWILIDRPRPTEPPSGSSPAVASASEPTAAPHEIPDEAPPDASTEDAVAADEAATTVPPVAAGAAAGSTSRPTSDAASEPPVVDDAPSDEGFETGPPESAEPAAAEGDVGRGDADGAIDGRAADDMPVDAESPTPPVDEPPPALRSTVETTSDTASNDAPAAAESDLARASTDGASGWIAEPASDESPANEPAAAAPSSAEPTSTPPAAELPSSDEGEATATGPPHYNEGDAGVVAPRPIERVAADYPRRARRQQIATQVVVAVLVDIDGRVIQTLLERRDRSGFGFNEAAEAAARETRFQPATQSGVVGSMWTRLIFDFRP